MILLLHRESRSETLHTMRRAPSTRTNPLANTNLRHQILPTFNYYYLPITTTTTCQQQLLLLANNNYYYLPTTAVARPDTFIPFDINLRKRQVTLDLALQTFTLQTMQTSTLQKFTLQTMQTSTIRHNYHCYFFTHAIQLTPSAQHSTASHHLSNHYQFQHYYFMPSTSSNSRNKQDTTARHQDRPPVT
jgi:hypothetical protein